VRYEPGKLVPAISLSVADGVIFTCPKCGGHQVLSWFSGRVPPDAKPGPGRSTPSGTGIDDLTLHPSIDLSKAGCGWHGWVKNGEAK
jgi:hypothetical protein